MRVYFFEMDEFVNIWLGKSLEKEEGEDEVLSFQIEVLDVDRWLFVNCVKQFKMYRCWL